MAVATSYPGVYIDEFEPAAPIQGVSTSVAAFIGPAPSGDLNVPTQITSWDAFKATFGTLPLPGFFLWYAVRSFFDNGGKVCYVVRASNGSYGTLALVDRTAAGNPLLNIRANQPGPQAIQITIADRHQLKSATTSLYQPTTTLSAVPTARDIPVAAGTAARFRPGDWITIAAAAERLQIVRITADTIRVGSNLGNAYVAGNVLRLADAPAGTQTVRVSSSVPVAPGVLVPGTMLTITQGGTSDSGIVDSVQTEYLSGGAITYRVTFRLGITTALSLDPANPATVQSDEFALTAALGIGSTTYDNLSIDSAHPNYVLTIVNADTTGLIQVAFVEPPPPTSPPLNLPLAGGPTGVTVGTLENLATLGANDYLTALDTLQQLHDVNLIAIPDASAAGIQATVQQAMITQCEQLGDRFAVLDASPGLALSGATSIETQRAGLDSTRGYAALYYPWLRVPPVGTGDPILVPPSGIACGIIANTDITRGVHKAPANVIVSDSLGVERTMSDVDQGLLNMAGINVFRVFATGARPVLFGARTTATDFNWQYVSTRRLFIYLEQSIELALRGSVFEPNNQTLWGQLTRTITDFLTRTWRDGALFGAKATDAFYVRIDDTINPFSEQALGRLHIEVGVRPAYPAEFIILRIGIWPGGSEITES